MIGPRGPEDEKKRQAAFIQQLPAAIEELARATEELLASGWDETFRRRACALATVLADSCAVYRLTPVTGLVRSIASLVRLPLEEVIPLQEALQEKLTELLTLLRDIGKDTERGTG